MSGFPCARVGVLLMLMLLEIRIGGASRRFRSASAVIEEAKMVLEEPISQRFNKLRLTAASRYNISPDKCHIGHLALEGMLEAPTAIHQIDGATNQKETNIAVAMRVMRFASALNNCGLKPGDPIVVMGPNHMDLCVPFYASHCNGYSMCIVDPITEQDDVERVFRNVRPKFVICDNICFEKVKQSLDINGINIPVVTFDNPTNDMQSFISKYEGTEANYKPNVFDTYTTPAWLLLTSGTTGHPKNTIITFETLYNGVKEWWKLVSDKIDILMALVGCQWVSSLLHFISTPLKGFTRLQSSVPLNSMAMVTLINKYRPTATSWTPYLLCQFLQLPAGAVDLSCLQHILVSGSAMEKPVIDKFKKICKAKLYLVYGMTELLVPVFEYDESTTPFGAAGKPSPQYEFKLVRSDNTTVEEIGEAGELWIKEPGHAFFKGYLNNPDETKNMLTEDGWFKTGDLFRRDEDNYYYFVERKKIVIRYCGTHWLSPLQMEQVIKRHPGVSEACVVGVPDPKSVELPVAAVQRKEGATVEAQEIFDIMKDALPEIKQLHGGLFFVDSFPVLVSGKLDRKKILQMAITAEKMLRPGSS